MDIAMIGLGKMVANMTTRLLGKGHRVVACDVKEAAVRAAEAGVATGHLDEAVKTVRAARRLGDGSSGNRPTKPSPDWRRCPGRTSSSLKETAT